MKGQGGGGGGSRAAAGPVKKGVRLMQRARSSRASMRRLSRLCSEMVFAATIVSEGTWTTL